MNSMITLRNVTNCVIIFRGFKTKLLYTWLISLDVKAEEGTILKKTVLKKFTQAD